MKGIVAFVLSAFVALFGLLGVTSAGAATREEITYVPHDADEKDILKTVLMAYGIPSSEYVCYWRGKRVRSGSFKKFSLIFSKRIIKEFFDANDCLLVASARRGFTLLDDEDLWSDRDIYRIKIDRPEIKKDIAILEVRIWSKFNSIEVLPVDEYDGGVVIHMIRGASGWRIDNIEGTDQLGAKPFNSLIEDESWRVPPWKGKDYSRSLTNPDSHMNGN